MFLGQAVRTIRAQTTNVIMSCDIIYRYQDEASYFFSNSEGGELEGGELAKRPVVCGGGGVIETVRCSCIMILPRLLF
jgi:hypothetical protein